MTKFDDKVNGNTVDASEYNDQVRSNKNAILAGGIAITSDNDQLAKSIVNHVGAANYYTDSGAANAYVLNTVGDFKAPTQLDAKTDGLLIRFRAANASTTASTVNVAGLGVKAIKLADGTTDIGAGDISNSIDTALRYDFANDVFLLQPIGTTAFKATMSANQVVTNAVITKVEYNTISFDTGSYYDNSTNYRFTPQVAGKYLCIVNLGFEDAGINPYGCSLEIRKNGSTVSLNTSRFFDNGDEYLSFSDIIEMNGSSDYIEAFGEIGGAGGNTFLAANSSFQAFKIFD
jgi:hypothetical protein